MASSNAGPITGGELIRAVQDGQTVYLTRPQVASLLAFTALTSPRASSFLTEKTGDENFRAVQGTARIEMNAADMLTYLAGTATPQEVPRDRQPAAFTGREKLVVRQGAMQVPIDLSQVLYVRGLGGSLGGVGGLPAPTPTPTPGGPYAHVFLEVGQSEGNGRGQFDSVIDAEPASHKQYSNISSLSDYRTFRSSTLPLRFPENRISENLLAPGNVAAKVMNPALMAANDIFVHLPGNWGGTSTINTASNSGPDPAPQWSENGNLLTSIISHANAAVAELLAQGYQIKAYISWDQGQADHTVATRAQYRAAATASLLKLRSSITGFSNARIGLMGFRPDRVAALSTLSEIEEALKEIAASIGNAFYVRGSNGYALDDGFNIHTNAAGTRVRGRKLGGGFAQIALAPQVTFIGDVTRQEGNSGTTAFAFQVGRDTFDGAVNVPIAFNPGSTSPDDFVGGAYPTGLVASFADGVDLVTVTVNYAGDTTVEPVESFTLTLQPNAPYTLGAKATATGTAANDDGGAQNFVATFDAPNGPLSSYTSESGDTFNAGNYAIANNEIYTTSSGTNKQTAPRVVTGDYGFKVGFIGRSISGAQYKTWREQDASNFFAFGIQNGTSTWHLFAMVNNSPTSLGTLTQPPNGFAIGQRYEADISHPLSTNMLTIKVGNDVVFGPTLVDRFGNGIHGYRQTGSMSTTTGIHITDDMTYTL